MYSSISVCFIHFFPLGCLISKNRNFCVWKMEWIACYFTNWHSFLPHCNRSSRTKIKFNFNFLVYLCLFIMQHNLRTTPNNFLFPGVGQSVNHRITNKTLKRPNWVQEKCIYKYHTLHFWCIYLVLVLVLVLIFIIFCTCVLRCIVLVFSKELKKDYDFRWLNSAHFKPFNHNMLLLKVATSYGLT